MGLVFTLGISGSHQMGQECVDVEAHHRRTAVSTLQNSATAWRVRRKARLVFSLTNPGQRQVYDLLCRQRVRADSNATLAIEQRTVTSLEPIDHFPQKGIPISPNEQKDRRQVIIAHVWVIAPHTT